MPRFSDGRFPPQKGAFERSLLPLAIFKGLSLVKIPDEAELLTSHLS